MFTGIINNTFNLFYINNSYNNYFIFIKIEHNNFLNLKLGESLSLNGVCFTISYKNFNFIEFFFCLETILNFNFINQNFNFNVDFPLLFKNLLNGFLNLGHINNYIFFLSSLKFLKSYKIFFLFNNNFKSFLIYKSSFNLNGVNLTLNEINVFDNYCILSFNLINFTYFFSNFKNIKILSSLNLELDLINFYILNHLCIY